MTHPAEQIVADAIMSGDTETGLRQITCNAAASTKMFCDCGAVLDQSTVHVLEAIQDGNEKTLAACCKPCAASHAVKLAALAKMEAPKGIRYRWQTWQRTIDIEPIVNLEFIHVGESGSVTTGTPVFKRTTSRPAAPKEPTAPKKERVPSIQQLLTGKNQSSHIKPYARKILEFSGLLIHRGNLIIRIKAGNTCAVTTEDERRKSDMVTRAFSIYGKSKDAGELGRGECVKISEYNCVRMMEKRELNHVCTVQELYLRAAEKHGNVYRWFPSIEIGDAETGSPSAIIGLNTAGERVAVIACVVDKG